MQLHEAWLGSFFPPGIGVRRPPPQPRARLAQPLKDSLVYMPCLYYNRISCIVCGRVFVWSIIPIKVKPLGTYSVGAYRGPLMERSTLRGDSTLRYHHTIC